jgi:peptidylamidoglycolate lyase
MKNFSRCFLRVVGLISFILAAESNASAEQNSIAAARIVQSDGPGGRYHVVHGWPVLPPGEVLGAVSGVGVDSRDHVFVFRRADRVALALGDFDMKPILRPTVLVFDGRTGAILSKWGAGEFAMPHGLYVDRQDNVWLTDVAYHQVYKYSADGKLLLAIGERGVPGDDAGHLNRPTDVAVAADGMIYVSDGYRNSRIVVFSSDGKFLFQWGTKGAGPGEFDVPHGIALDGRGQVYVADRTNARVQVFDSRGKYLSQWKAAALGRPYDVAFGRDDLAVVVDGGDQPKGPPDRAGAAIVRPDGTVVEQFGSFGNYDGQFMMAHDVAVASNGAIYVGDITGGRVQKFVRDTQ